MPLPDRSENLGDNKFRVWFGAQSVVVTKSRERPYASVSSPGEVHLPAYLRANELLLRINEGRAKKLGRIVDYGCGSAYGTCLLASLFPAAEVTGVDVSDEALAFARLRAPEAHGFVRSCDDWDDCSVDAVVAIEVVEHMEDPVGWLRNIRRVLHHTGILILSTPERSTATGANPFHLREYSQTGLMELCDDARFEVWVFERGRDFGSQMFVLARRRDDLWTVSGKEGCF